MGVGRADVCSFAAVLVLTFDVVAQFARLCRTEFTLTHRRQKRLFPFALFDDADANFSAARIRHPFHAWGLLN